MYEATLYIHAVSVRVTVYIHTCCCVHAHSGTWICGDLGQSPTEGLDSDLNGYCKLCSDWTIFVMSYRFHGTSVLAILKIMFAS